MLKTDARQRILLGKVVAWQIFTKGERKGGGDTGQMLAIADEGGSQGLDLAEMI